MTASLTLTPSQARFMQETKERRLRFAAKVKPPPPPKPVAIVPIAPPEPAPPPKYKQWFRIVDDAEGLPPMIAIQHICADFYGLTMAQMLSERRTSNLVRARQVGMFLCKEFTLRSLPEIGRRFGHRDHTTVLHAVRKIEEKERYDNDLAEALNILRERIRGKA